jgi:hypothetical protein
MDGRIRRIDERIREYEDLLSKPGRTDYEQIQILLDNCKERRNEILKRMAPDKSGLALTS